MSRPQTELLIFVNSVSYETNISLNKDELQSLCKEIVIEATQRFVQFS